MGKITPAKARKILEDGTIRGKKLTPKQRRYFGWIAAGMKPKQKKRRAKSRRS